MLSPCFLASVPGVKVVLARAQTSRKAGPGLLLCVGHQM